MERMLEALSIYMFRALKLGDLVNKNQITVNFPAIDLADDSKKIAIQVTSKATPKKIKDTIAAFEKKTPSGSSIKDKYTTLYILGFCKASKTTIPSYCKVIDPSYFIVELCDKADEDQIKGMLDALRRHTDYSSLHPWADKDSLEIILNTINRSAIKHMMPCEGDITEMSKGLKEITELITKGTIGGKSRAKSISDFNDENMTKFLREVLEDISAIQAIVNKSRIDQTHLVGIGLEGMTAIDKLKKSIADRSSAIAKANNIGIEIKLITLSE
ncbi:hypothetical protein LT17_03732 [Pseudomonas aeruginosa]|nr:hypothetical protein LT17_03732 [Pseudomonas aeruginosa]